MNRIDTNEFLRQRADKRQTFGEIGLAKVAQVKIDYRAARVVNGAACLPFMVESLREFVARAELHVFVFRLADGRFRPQAVILQVTVAVLVRQDTAFTTAAFGHQNAGAGQTGRVVLHEFHVAQRHAVAVSERHAVAGDDAAVSVEGKNAPGTAGGDDDGFRLHRTQHAVLYVVAEDAVQLAFGFNQIQREMFIQAGNVGELQRGLEQRMQHVEAALVGGEPGARNFHPAETAHVGATIGQARPRAAPVLHLDHFFRGVFDEILHHVLLAQPVAAGDGVVKVIFQRVIFAHHPGRAAFRRNRMATHRINF